MTVFCDVLVPAGTFGTKTCRDQNDRYTYREIYYKHDRPHVNFYGVALLVTHWYEGIVRGWRGRASGRCPECDTRRSR